MSATHAVTCFECGHTHEATFSHMSNTWGDPTITAHKVYAVVCDQDPHGYVDYYTDEVVFEKDWTNYHV